LYLFFSCGVLASVSGNKRQKEKTYAA
jgi:hypothetical protein